MAIPIPPDVRELLDAPNYIHLSTLRADGSPRNWVVWAGLEDDHILVCTSDAIWKAKDMRRDPRVAMSVTDMANPYRMAAIQGRVAEVRPDEGCRYMDPISVKYRLAIDVGQPYEAFCQRYEAAVPAVDGEQLAKRLSAGADWVQVVADAAAGAPYGFLRYWKFEATALSLFHPRSRGSEGRGWLCRADLPAQGPVRPCLPAAACG